MATTFMPGPYVAVQFDKDKGNTVLGVVELDKKGMLTALIIEEGGKQALPKLITYLNGKNSLQVEAAPPEDALPHEKFSKKVERGQLEYLTALADYMARYYDVVLEPAAANSLPIGVGTQENYRDDPYMDLTDEDDDEAAAVLLDLPESDEPESDEPEA